MKNLPVFLLFYILLQASCIAPKYTDFNLSDKKFVLADSFDVSKTFDEGNLPLFIPTGSYAAENKLIFLESGSYYMYAFDTLGKNLIAEKDIFPFHLKNHALQFAFKHDSCFFYSNKNKHLYKLSFYGQYDSVPNPEHKNFKSLLWVNDKGDMVFFDVTGLPAKKNKDGSFNYSSKMIKERKVLLSVQEDGKKRRFFVFPKFMNIAKVWNINYPLVTDGEITYVKRIDNHLIDVFNRKGRKLFSFGQNSQYYHYITKKEVKKLQKRKDLMFFPSIFAKEKGKNNFITVYPSFGKEQNVPVLYQNFDKKEYSEFIVKSMYVLPYTANGKIYVLQPRNPQKIYVYELL